MVGFSDSAAVVSDACVDLTKKKIDEGIAKLKKFAPSMFREYKHIYGAVIFSRSRKAAVEHAIKQGLIVIKHHYKSGATPSLVNQEGFKPKILVRNKVRAKGA